MDHRPLSPTGIAVCSAIFYLQLSNLTAGQTHTTQIESPDGQLRAEVFLSPTGTPGYRILRAHQPILLDSELGLVREDADFTRDLRWLDVGPLSQVADHYELPGSKRLMNHYHANRRVVQLATPTGSQLRVVFQVSNDGVAFRYEFPEVSPTIHRIREERTSFRFDPASKAWLQPIAEAKSSWGRCNPSYEEYYDYDIAVGTPPSSGVGWVFPALFRPPSQTDTWVLVSETGLQANYCASRLRPDSPGGEYRIGFPDPRETAFEGIVTPQSALPWATPWRVIAVGSLATVMESTLGTDLAPAPTVPYRVEPGKAAWSWVMLKDEKTTESVQRSFVDYAARMGWRYCLVDALWDTQIGYDRMRELCRDAAAKNVGILVWYNSAGDWNDTPQTPKNLLLSRERRLQEFRRIKEIGVTGLKIDFFGGDGQSMIGYYLDILKDAEAFGLLVNFHGCTLPRGWQRTYPHLLTMEAVRGMEFVTFEQGWADRAPRHMVMLPFARNVFDPMDFTPMSLDRIPNIKRHTSSGFELATAVLYVSGIQHYAETPEGMATMPEEVQGFVRSIPSVWEEVRFLAGHPADHLVMARKAGKHWFLAGISAAAKTQEIELDLTRLGQTGAGILIQDETASADARLVSQAIQPSPKGRLRVTLRPQGGFVARLSASPE